MALVLKNDTHALMRLKIVFCVYVRWLFYISSLDVKPWREDRVTYLRPEQRRVEVIQHVVLTRHRCQPKEMSRCPYLHPSLLWASIFLDENCSHAPIYALLPSSTSLEVRLAMLGSKKSWSRPNNRNHILFSGSALSTNGTLNKLTKDYYVKEISSLAAVGLITL